MTYRIEMRTAGGRNAWLPLGHYTDRAECILMARSIAAELPHHIRVVDRDGKAVIDFNTYPGTYTGGSDDETVLT